MALIQCPECDRRISDKAHACPGCGCPVDVSPAIPNPSDSKTAAEAQQPTPARPATEESPSILVALWNFFEKKPRTCTVLLFIPLILLALIWERWSDSGKEQVKPEQPPATSPSTVATPTLMEQGKAAFASGKYDEAISHFTKAIDAKQGGHGAFELRAQCYIASKKFTEAVADLSAVIESVPRSQIGFVAQRERARTLRARLERAKTYVRMARFEECIADCDVLIGDFNPRSGERPTGLHVGEDCHRPMQLGSPATPLIRPIAPPGLESKTHEALGLVVYQALIVRAAARTRTGKPALAIQELDAIIGEKIIVTAVSKWRFVETGFGKIERVEIGPYKQMKVKPKGYYEPAERKHYLYSFGPSALPIRGDAKAMLGDWEAALSDYEQALKLKGDDPDILADIASAYSQLGRRNEAAEVLSRIPSHHRLNDDGLPSVEPAFIRVISEGDSLGYHVLDQIKSFRLDDKKAGDIFQSPRSREPE